MLAWYVQQFVSTLHFLSEKRGSSPTSQATLRSLRHSAPVASGGSSSLGARHGSLGSAVDQALDSDNTVLLSSLPFSVLYSFRRLSFAASPIPPPSFDSALSYVSNRPYGSRQASFPLHLPLSLALPMSQFPGAPDWLTQFIQFPEEETPSHPPLPPIQLGLTPSYPLSTPFTSSSHRTGLSYPPPPFSPPSFPFEPISQPPYATASPLSLVSQTSNDPPSRLSTVSHVRKRVKAPHRPQARQVGGGGRRRAQVFARPGSNGRDGYDSERTFGSNEVPIIEWQADPFVPNQNSSDNSCQCHSRPPNIPRDYQYYHAFHVKDTIDGQYPTSSPEDVRARRLKQEQLEMESQLDTRRRGHLSALQGWNPDAEGGIQKPNYRTRRDRAKRQLQTAVARYEEFLKKNGLITTGDEQISKVQYLEKLREHEKAVFDSQAERRAKWNPDQHRRT